MILTPLLVRLLLLVNTAFVPSDVEGLDTIRAAYAEQVNSIDSIETTIIVDWAVSETFDGGTTGETTHHDSTRWARDGKKRKADITRRSEQLPDGSRRETYWFDGRDLRRAHWNDAGDELITVYIFPELDGVLESTFQPDDLLGIRLPESESSLEDLLTRPDAKVIGTESIEGHSCVKVDLGIPGRRGRAGHWKYLIWFDPAAGYLPRKIRADFIPERHPDTRTKVFWKEFVVTKFLEVADPQRGRRSFPESVTRRSYRVTNNKVLETVRQISLSDVSVNRPVSEESLTLELTPGTTINDQRVPEGALPKLSVVGSADELKALATEKERELGRRVAASAGQTLDATPGAISLFPWFLAAAGLCLAIAVVMRWRHAR